MHCLSLTLQQGGAINCLAYGAFSGNKKLDEVIVARGGGVLELLMVDPETQSLVSVLSQPTFGVVRSLMSFKLAGSSKDYCAIGSDSGKLSIVEYNPEANELVQVHLETFGRTACRRIVPGQYLAADPAGRALMVAATEKQKLVYIINRDASNRLTISSPLEAHKPNAICYACVGIDVGFENPVFACIELDYADADNDPTGEEALNTEKHLVYYHLDLGLNHVTRMWSDVISRTANFLLPVPGGTAGPSGVLVCGENWVAYKHQEHTEVRAPIPRRAGMPVERGVLITSGVMHKQKSMTFFIIQSELGDLYKVTLDTANENKEVVGLNVEVFDTVPVARQLAVTRKGLLFLASEFSNHMLFQFSGLGGGEGAVVSTRCDDPDLGDDAESASKAAPTFKPGPLQNLVQLDEMESLSPVTDMLVGDFTKENSNQIYALCGRGNRSSLRILRHGAAVSEMAVSELPGHPSAVWAVKERTEDPFIKYIVVSFSNATLVLGVGETVEEVTDSGFLATAPTLAVCLLDNNSKLQVHANGLRMLAPGRAPQEWRTPGKKTIEKAAANSRQAVIALAGGEIIYFELDPSMQMLQEVGTKELGTEVSCLDIGEVPEGRVRAPFLVAGDWSGTVKVLSLAPESLMTQQSLLNLPAAPESLCLMGGGGGDQLYLNVGLSNGTMQTAMVDTTAGTLSGVRMRFLGSKPVKMCRLKVQGAEGVLALSSRSWLSYSHQGRHINTPLSYDMLEGASPFATEQVPEGIVAISENTLRIIAVERLGQMFNQQAIPLRYTPRQAAVLGGPTPKLLVVEADNNEYNEAERAELARQLVKGDTFHRTEGDMEIDGAAPKPPDEEGEEGETPMPIRGPLPPVSGKWASCVRLLDPAQGTTLECLELGENEAAFSVASITFHSRGGEAFVAVGTAKDLQFHPTRNGGCFVRVYRVLDNRLVLLHSTSVPDLPLAMAEFQGRLLVGSGRCLRMFDLGKKKLLRKCEHKGFPTAISSLQVFGDRIVVGDMAESLMFVKYNRGDNTMAIFADDQVPRFTTKTCLLDYDTAAGADKFGNMFVLRVPADVSDDVDNPMGTRALWDTSTGGGAPNKLQQMIQYHIGEVVTCLRKTELVAGGAQVILYATIGGTLGALLPFKNREDIDFYTHLEMYMRQDMAAICGRDHISYRSYFLPVSNTTDGDLCEEFSSLSSEKQQKIATGLERTPWEVTKKMEDVRNSIM
ncbi:unnamed protein product [Chrysoparadoxa australica]